VAFENFVTVVVYGSEPVGGLHATR
jgi:hypothetical protein